MSECTTYWRTKERHIRQSSAHAFNFSRIEYRILLLLHLVSTLHSPLWMHRMFECALRFFKKSIFSIHNSYIREKRAQVISRQKITCETFGHISFVFCFWAPVHFFFVFLLLLFVSVSPAATRTHRMDGHRKHQVISFIFIYSGSVENVIYLFSAWSWSAFFAKEHCLALVAGSSYGTNVHSLAFCEASHRQTQHQVLQAATLLAVTETNK